MPSLSDALVGSMDLSRYSPVNASNAPSTASPGSALEPDRNAFMRCPLPPIFQASPDNLRQFYLGGKVPQNRLLTPLPPVTSAGSGSSSSTTSTTVIPSGGSSSGTTPIAAAQVVLQTATISPGGTFAGSITVSRSFQLLSLAANAACRIEVYGTAATQTQDLSRALDVPPALGTTQNIICDVALDTVPYQWSFQNRIGANTESPQIARVYVTVTNLGSGPLPVTVTFQYVPLES